MSKGVDSLLDFDIERRLRYAGIDRATGRRLRGFWRVARLALPGILDSFYDHVRAEPLLAGMIGTQTDRLKRAQSSHWERLFSGRFDEAYVHGVHAVGLAHMRIGMEPRWYVAGYQFVLNRLVRLVVLTWFWNPWVMWRTLTALNKAVMLDMELAISAYQYAVEEDKRRQEAAVIASVGVGLEALANGDLTHKVVEDLHGPLEKLKDDFNAAAPKLQTTLQSVVGSIDTIFTGAREIEDATDDLSRRTENQAASLEQTAAALEQITATVKSTAANAVEVSSIVKKTKDGAQSSGAIVEATVAAMGQIAQSSKQINDIIGVIDEIAFQTNLLALNAGVEAARAGDAGRGFAVVASEVRALAGRSSEAAKEIKTLIKTSSEHVGAGVKYVGESCEALKRIVDQVTQISTLVGEMAGAAEQQATGIQEVNAAVCQMDQVTQQNAAMVEEATAASRNLAGETQALTEMVRFFNVGGHSMVPAKAAASRPQRAAPAAKPQLKHSGNRMTATAVKPSADEWTEF